MRIGIKHGCLNENRYHVIDCVLRRGGPGDPPDRAPQGPPPGRRPVHGRCGVRRTAGGRRGDPLPRHRSRRDGGCGTSDVLLHGHRQHPVRFLVRVFQLHLSWQELAHDPGPGTSSCLPEHCVYHGECRRQEVWLRRLHRRRRELAYFGPLLNGYSTLTTGRRSTRGRRSKAAAIRAGGSRQTTSCTGTAAGLS